jgi:hypothetical protein
VTTEAVERARSGEREWWLRALLVVQSPRAVFAALRDDSQDAVVQRQEPVLAIVLLAGIAGVLMTSVAGRLLDDSEYDVAVLLVYLFVAGLVHGFAGLFILGGLLYLGASLVGSLGSFRQARHILAFAAIPILLTLVVWPIRLALYGEDVFRRGGADTGTGASAFEWLEWAAVGWSLALLAIGVHVVHGWSRPRTAAAVVLPALVPALVAAESLGLLDRLRFE